jgi:uncharacterized protein with HEPN domain
MSRHDDNVSMRQMLEHAKEAVNMSRGRTRADLETDRMLQLALTRLLEIVGEAAARVSLNARERYERITWYQILGMRNRLAHGYDAIDLNILWDIIQADLPPLIAELDAVLGHQT